MSKTEKKPMTNKQVISHLKSKGFKIWNTGEQYYLQINACLFSCKESELQTFISKNVPYYN